MARKKRSKAKRTTKRKARKTTRKRKKAHKKRRTPKWSAAHRRSFKAAKHALIQKFNRSA